MAETKAEPKQYTGTLVTCWPVKGDRKFSIMTAAGERNMLESRIASSDMESMGKALDMVFDASPKVLTLGGLVPISMVKANLDKPLEDLVVGCIDLETTGLYPWGKDRNGCEVEADRITEFAIVRGKPAEGGLEETLSYSTLMYPERRIPQVVTDLTGLKSSDVAMYPTWRDMEAHITSLVKTCDVLVAHHAPFEQGFIASSYQREGVRVPDMLMLDTKVMAKKTGGFTNHKQVTVAAAIGVEYIGNAHRALPDAQVCYRLVQHFLVKCIAQGDKTLRDVVVRFAE
jgi:DNA polymerase III alpha subunit (gram-positive type)